MINDADEQSSKHGGFLAIRPSTRQQEENGVRK
jgi:hypothetical protein